MSEPAKPPDPPSTDLVTATHEALFTEDPLRCESCGDELTSEDDSGILPSGRGALVWVRGDERREQGAPLCAPCATAIGVSALRAWEVEEDEG